MTAKTPLTRAEILIQALPYIQSYHGRILVIKYGGNAMLSNELQQLVMRDIALLHQIGIKVVLVHGGGPDISKLLNQVGKKSEFIDGLRVTDKETVEYVQMVLSGKTNKSLVHLLEDSGCESVGISGVDGRLLEAKPLSTELGYVGEITQVNTKIIHDILEKGYVPVISTVGCDRSGNIYNINADTAAAYIAGALQAESLIVMTDIRGILRHAGDPSSLIPEIQVSDARLLIRDGIISGGMIPKVECCIEAIRRGVSRVFILDGSIPHAILLEVLSDEGSGTMFTR